MKQQKRENPKPFTPVKGEVYENVAGGKFLCESSWEDDHQRPCAWMINIKTGWSLTANGVVRYEDGTIEWDYSNGEGFLPIDDRRQQLIDRAIEWDYSNGEGFLPIDDRRQQLIDRAIQREIDRKVTRAIFKARQNSIMNAMLCCLI